MDQSESWLFMIAVLVLCVAIACLIEWVTEPEKHSLKIQGEVQAAAQEKALEFQVALHKAEISKIPKEGVDK